MRQSISIGEKKMGKTVCSRKILSVFAGITAMVLASPAAQAGGPVAAVPGKSGKVVVAKHPSSPVEFTLGVGAGYLTGEANEVVYWPEYNNHKASELTWKIDNLFMVGIGATLKVGDWFVANLDTWVKATDGDGTMDDYDWRIVGGDWTDWSHHEDTDVTDGSIVDINANFAFYKTQNVKLTGIVGYKRDNFGWDARGGEYVYSNNGFRDATGTFPDDELGISYEQTMASLYGGIGFAAEFSGNFKMSGRLIYSPIVNGEATDHHHMRNLVTYDDFEGENLIGFDLSGTFYFQNNLALEVMFSHQSYDMMQGDSEWHFRDEGVVYVIDDGAGMDHSSSLLSVALQYTF